MTALSFVWVYPYSKTADVTPVWILWHAFCLCWVDYPHVCLGHILGHRSTLYQFGVDTYSGVGYASAVWTVYCKCC